MHVSDCSDSGGDADHWEMDSASGSDVSGVDDASEAVLAGAPSEEGIRGTAGANAPRDGPRAW
eukprot:10524252-Lingulodinium_polyedra.AAC.1